MHRTVYGWYVGWLKQPCERTEQVDGYGWKPIHRKWSIVGIKLSVQKYNRSSNAFLIGFDHCNHVTSVDWTNLFFFSFDITKKQDEQMTINVVLKPNDASATSVQGWLQNRKLYWYFLHFISMFLCIHTYIDNTFSVLELYRYLETSEFVILLNYDSTGTFHRYTIV